MGVCGSGRGRGWAVGGRRESGRTVGEAVGVVGVCVGGGCVVGVIVGSLMGAVGAKTTKTC